MSTEYELTLFDYLSIIRRRAAYMIAIFAAGLLVAIAVAILMPKTYRATGTILVESAQVSDNIVASSIRNKFDERIGTIKQRVLTRENLLHFADKYGLFKDKRASLTTTELLEKIKERIEIETVTSDSRSGGWQAQPTIAFEMSFIDPDPEVALQVANELISMFLDWNVRLRTEGATETTQFLTQESDRLKAEVDRIEERISAYKRQNSDNLPEQLSLRTTMLSRAENDLYAVERDMRSASEELRSLEAEELAARRGVSDDPTQTLMALKAEYNKLSAIYTESHPDIRSLKRKIEALENPASTTDSTDITANVSSLTAYKIKAKIDSVNARIASLEQQKIMLKAKISQNEHAMELTPRVAQGLEILVRERNSAQQKYEELLGKKMTAKISENLESENKSERFTLIEPPTLPEKPYKPNPKKIFAMGLFLAIGCAVGVAAVLEMIDKRVRGAEALAHILGYRPLVVIPFLHIEEEGVSRKRILFREIVDAIWPWTRK